MLAKRIIPCLDVKDGRTVKGIQFNNLRDSGDPVELAARYSEQGADELVLLDITATLQGRQTFLSIVKDVAAAVAIPFTVGGGISSMPQVEQLLASGADKISLNTAAITKPELITEIAENFGNQCVVVAIDVRLIGEKWMVVSHAGTRTTPLHALEWSLEAEQRGAGEILLTSFTADGTQNGFSISITKEISNAVGIPLIASGGAGNAQHFLDVFLQAEADAALAAGILHTQKSSIPQIKQYLFENNIPVRL